MQKPEPKIVIGLMSGTSADGIDASVVKINPDLSVKVLASLLYEYPDNIREYIHKLFSKKADIEELCWMNFVLGEYFASAALDVIDLVGLKPKDIDLIGSHGQTVYHFPQESQINLMSRKSTLQIGESSIIAERTGITTVSDFRPRDIAAGGQGAPPLVCFADEILFKSDKLSRAVQNIGGMANVTVLSS
ncbi:MAG: anhydro-N-acetylmuramic acid kinase [Desulfosudis oleivorans]|nr:anhydro-N-acetylmuramic acid kinase [Desulfosudis oleivorans]